MKRFIEDLKKYWNYIIFSTKAELKSEIVNSYLGWVWLILEPLCFMLIYTFIAGVVFKSKVEFFPVFVFIGLSVWNFFNKTVTMGVKLVVTNKDTVTKVYLPKFVLLLVKIGVNSFKMFISFILVAIFMTIYQIPISWNILYVIPLTIILELLTFGIGSIVMHLGVFAEDLRNIIDIAFKLVFYLSGIFYNIVVRVPAPYNSYLMANPIAYLISDFRNVLMYQTSPNLLLMGAWFLIGLVLSIIGIRTIYKYENTYVKVMKA